MAAIFLQCYSMTLSFFGSWSSSPSNNLCHLLCVFFQVSETDDRMLNRMIQKLEAENAEVDGDADSDEDTGMGNADVSKIAYHEEA